MPDPNTKEFDATVVGDDPNQYVDLLQRVVAWADIDLVLDVGAHAGEFGATLRHRVGYEGRIVSFEPDPDTFERLGAQIDHDLAWDAVNVAVGSTNSRGSLTRFSRSNFNSMHLPAKALTDWYQIDLVDTLEVDVVNLQTWLKQDVQAERVLVKTDTQGHDIEVLEGIGEQDWQRIAAVQVELSAMPIYQGEQHWTRVIDSLEARGLWCAGMFPVSRDPGLLRVVEFDGIFVRDV